MAGAEETAVQAGAKAVLKAVSGLHPEEALARLLDMLTRPLLDEAEQLRERDVVHAEFIARSQDVDTLLGAALGQALAEGHRCAVFQAGNRGTLPVADAAFQQALRTFHQAFYHAGNCQLSIVAPLSLVHLTALSQRYGALLPQAQAVVRSRPAPLLPLRTERLRLNLPNATATLHLGFALELPETHADSALDWLLGWLLDEAPAGLNAGLRERGLGEVARARVLYCHAGQALLLLSMRGVAGPDEAVALLLDWLAFVSAQADPLAWHKAYQQTRQLRLCGMTPLALARDWQAPASDDGGAICQLLQQLQEPQRRCVLLADEHEAQAVPGAVEFGVDLQGSAKGGFSLREFAHFFTEVTQVEPAGGRTRLGSHLALQGLQSTRLVALLRQHMSPGRQCIDVGRVRAQHVVKAQQCALPLSEHQQRSHLPAGKKVFDFRHH